MTISLVNGVNPLQTTLLELGIVSGRVALLLRSAEIQPLFGRFVSNTYSVFTPFSLGLALLQGVQMVRPSSAPKCPSCPCRVETK